MGFNSAFKGLKTQSIEIYFPRYLLKELKIHQSRTIEKLNPVVCI